MSSTIISRYVNAKGRDAMVLTRHEYGGRVSYGYMGTLGAGCGKDENEVKQRAADCVRGRRNVQLVEGVEIR